jgi:hypothetical protein
MTIQEKSLKRHASVQSLAREDRTEGSAEFRAQRQAGNSSSAQNLWIAMAGRILFLLVAVFVPAVSFAQVDQGAITGVVADSSGAVIAGATVKLKAGDSHSRALR